MALERVRPNEAIRAQTINTLIDGYNSNGEIGGINTPPLAGRMNPLGAFGIVTIRNNSNTNIPSGGVLKITGIRNLTLTPEDTTEPEYARKLWMNSGYQLDGNTPSDSADQVAIAVLGIPAGRIGYAIVPGIFASYVCNAQTASSEWDDPDVPEYTDSQTYAIPGAAGITGLTSAASGPFKIVAATAAEVITQDGPPTKFCYLIPNTVSASTGGGHRLGVTTSTATQNEARTATVSVEILATLETISALIPLAKQNDVISADRRCIVGQNSDTGAWEILNLECEDVA